MAVDWPIEGFCVCPRTLACWALYGDMAPTNLAWLRLYFNDIRLVLDQMECERVEDQIAFARILLHSLRLLILALPAPVLTIGFDDDLDPDPHIHAAGGQTDLLIPRC